MPRIVEGNLSAAGLRFGVVLSRFNSFITDRLLDGALDAIKRSGGDPDAVTVYRTPGSFEIPAVVKRVATSGEHDAVVCLGAVIRGATPHFEYIAAEVAKGVAAVAMQASCPVAFGVLTCDSEGQAWERAGGKAGNRGADAARAALELVDLYRQVGS